MNPAMLSVTPSSSSSASTPALFSPFINPSPLRLTPSSLSLPSRRRVRVSVPRNSADVSPPDDSAASAAPPATTTSVFGERKELTGIQPLVDGLSPPLRLASSAVILAGAVAAGYGLGLRFGGNRNLALGGAAAMGAAGGAMVYALNAAVPEVAAASLHNYVAGFDDPGAVKKEEIEQIAKKSVPSCCDFHSYLHFLIILLWHLCEAMKLAFPSFFSLPSSALASFEFWGFNV
ncbi:unnamed protein product [Linum tenue]|uniref:Uncharacterized protein n=1 Tax=Linum tenue TaxID=586396 RepID=A0AAV0IQB8_9ROSI|nr:unnamed protein product [Linum tenue]